MECYAILPDFVMDVSEVLYSSNPPLDLVFGE